MGDVGSCAKLIGQTTDRKARGEAGEAEEDGNGPRGGDGGDGGDGGEGPRGADDGDGEGPYSGDGDEEPRGACDGGAMRFRPIDITDKPRFDALFESIQPQISDLTFSNLFMWRRLIRLQVCWVGGFAAILALPMRYPPYVYAPVGDMADEVGFARAALLTCEHFRAMGWAPRFRCVPADAAKALMRILRACGFDAACEPDRDFFDYVYGAEDLIGLRGRKFDGKRNHINRFRRSYAFEYEELDDAHIGDCVRIMRERCEESGCACLRGELDACDRTPSMELLAHFGELSCRGAVIRVDGRCEAFTVGEALNRDTAVIYIEKANAAFNGLYSFINQQFCERAWPGMAYINREEDEGIEGLRKAKLSYHPVRLVEKFTVKCDAR